MRAALALLGGLPASLPDKVAVVEADGPRLTLRFTHGPLVVWGDSSRALAKTLALRAVLARYEEAGKTCVYMDVSVPDRVLAAPRAQVTPGQSLRLSASMCASGSSRVFGG